jgi:thioredoxin-like negative regulator of GroEL
MSQLPILTEINDRNHFAELLIQNPGLLIIKFGADWCGPCKKIERLVKEWFDRTNHKVQCAIIDVDESFDVYAFLKSKKMVHGIPAILCYENNNHTYIPNDTVIGADVEQINAFFTRNLSKVM